MALFGAIAVGIIIILIVIDGMTKSEIKSGVADFKKKQVDPIVEVVNTLNERVRIHQLDFKEFKREMYEKRKVSIEKLLTVVKDDKEVANLNIELEKIYEFLG